MIEGRPRRSRQEQRYWKNDYSFFLDKISLFLGNKDQNRKIKRNREFFKSHFNCFWEEMFCPDRSSLLRCMVVGEVRVSNPLCSILIDCRIGMMLAPPRLLVVWVHLVGPSRITKRKTHKNGVYRVKTVKKVFQWSKNSVQYFVCTTMSLTALDGSLNLVPFFK